MKPKIKGECKNCDYKNPVWKGRGYAVCPNCGRDYTIELCLLRKPNKLDI